MITYFLTPINGIHALAISSAISVNLLLFGVAGPIGGWLLDRFGPRPAVSASPVAASNRLLRRAHSDQTEIIRIRTNPG